MIDKKARKEGFRAKNHSEESPHAIFIEMDGVIVDSDEVLFEVFNRFLKKYGIDTSWLEFYSLKGLPLAEMIHRLCDKYGLRNSIEKLVSEYYLLLKQSYNNNLPLKEESRQVLKYAYDQGFSLNLIVTFQDKFIKEYLKAANVAEFFDAIVTTDEMIIENIPNLYQKALNLQGVEKEEAIAIVATQQGLKSAAEVGIEVWLLGPNHVKDWAAIHKKLSNFSSEL